ncbi:MAG: RDD family protein [Corynebacterium sp.]|uniref:RDD family protein n=1 Tax=Corynebacterium sp. TaxID=1720 RepID=UPI0026DFEDD9|nr:RDD family protein [Corynebacterium sp.]MDO5669652.1 RDD family protein [Corynebacterium sp.]
MNGTAHPAPPEHLAPAPAGLLTRGAATGGEVLAVILTGLALQALTRQPLGWDVVASTMLIAAALRIVTETGWGASPGKWLAGIRVKFPGEARWMRLPQSLLRNTWLWLPPLTVLFRPQEEELWVMATAVGISIVLGPDRRSVTDLLAGAFVIDPSAPRRVADPVDHVSPRRALAWAVDMALATLAGLALAPVLDWSWWARGLVVLAVIRLLSETLGVPSPGKALLRVRVDYPAGLRVVRAIARNLWLLPAILIAATVGHSVLLVEGFIALTFIYIPAQRSVTDLLAQAKVRVSG